MWQSRGPEAAQQQRPDGAVVAWRVVVAAAGTAAEAASVKKKKDVVTRRVSDAASRERCGGDDWQFLLISYKKQRFPSFHDNATILITALNVVIQD